MAELAQLCDDMAAAGTPEEGYVLQPNKLYLGRTHEYTKTRCFVPMLEGRSSIGAAIREAYPDALACAERLAALLELRMGTPLSDDEVSYLTLHVARATTDH